MSTKRMPGFLTVLSLLLYASLAIPNTQAETYRFTILAVPGAISTSATSINASGQVAGSYRDSSGLYGFVYSNGTFTTLQVPGATRTWASSINNSGQVAGFYEDGSNEYGFVYSNGTFTTLQVPGATGTRAGSINNSGQVAGSYWNSSGSYGFVYSNGTFTTLQVPGATRTWASSINNSGQVAGSYMDGADWGHGFVYSNGTFTTLQVPGAAGTRADSINNSGQVAGSYYPSSPVGAHGFVYSNGTFTTFDIGSAISLLSINASGQVTGYYFTVFPGIRFPPYFSFVYSNGTFTRLQVPGARNTWASSINNSGQVAGSYMDGAGGAHSFIATPVCAAPTVAIHTLTTAPNDWFRITGSITLDGVPLCALVLANGQFMFTCGDPLPKGDFDLTVPPDAQGQITLFGFSSGLAPFQQTLGAGSLPASVNANICATPTVTHTVTAAPNGWFRITGSIALDGVPLCALVLANGQFMFTCGDPLPEGDFDLTVPPDAQGQITLFGFSSGLAPFQQTFSPSSPTSTP